MSTPSLRHRIAAAAITAGAIAIGALAVGTATAQAETFQQSCENHPELYAAGAVRGVYSVQRIGDDRYQNCTTYDANGKKLGTNSVPEYGWYLSPKHQRPGQASPTPVLQK
jgi:hypothetical protein